MGLSTFASKPVEEVGRKANGSTSSRATGPATRRGHGPAAATRPPAGAQA